MFQNLKIVCFYLIFFVTNNLYSSSIEPITKNLSQISCSELMLDLIKESSFNETFSNSKKPLAFGFERYDKDIIMLKFVYTKGIYKKIIYGNFKLDLIKHTLEIIDQEQPIPIKINKRYLPYIATKCTPDENIYINTGHLPN